MTYRLVDKYFQLEEIEDSLFLLEMKLKSLNLKQLRPNSNLTEKKCFIEVKGKDHLITTKNINFPSNIQLASEHKYIGFITSIDLDLKIVMLIHKNKGLRFTPVKKVNYILEKNTDMNYAIIIDILTNLAETPFSTLKHTLKNMKIN